MTCDTSAPRTWAVCPRCGTGHWSRPGCEHRCGTQGPTPPKPPGVGAHLARRLARWGVTDTAACRCRSMAAEMDRLGPEGVRERLDEFAGRLADEAEKRGWWLTKKGRPIVMWAARRMILAACRDASRVQM